MSQIEPSHTHGNCHELLTQLNDYLDGDLPAGLCADLEAHLAGCTDCRVVLDTLDRTVHILRNLDSTPPPLLPALEARLLEHIARHLKGAGEPGSPIA
jgi:anti-sigma factor RsiW